MTENKYAGEVTIVTHPPPPIAMYSLVPKINKDAFSAISRIRSGGSSGFV
jgi:hypothetical protein